MNAPLIVFLLFWLICGLINVRVAMISPPTVTGWWWKCVFLGPVGTVFFIILTIKRIKELREKDSKPK